MDGATVKTLSTIHYNVFSPSQALMTHYNVLQLSDRKMILESYQDLSGLGDGYSSNERGWKFIRQYPKLKILLLIGDKIRITIL